MTPAESRRRSEEERRADRSIQQTAGDGATQIGQVHGNVYIGGPAPESEVPLDLDAYREHQLSQLAIWERQYTRLDVDPAVALAGQDLRPVPDSRLALTEAFLRHERLVVVGGAGAGKTTSMLYLVASVLPGGSLSGRLADFVPVYIELGRFRGDASSSPLDQLLLLIAETLFRGKACSEPPSLRGVRQLLAAHRFLFLLDGVNEAQAGLRASCVAAIDDLAKRYPDHRIVLSSRPHGFSPPQGWDVALLRELEDTQIPEFVERYTHDEASHFLLQAVLEAHNPLLRVPLFLSLVVRMGGSPLPNLQRRLRSRSGLVAQYVEFLLQRDPSSPADVLSIDRLRGALERLAQAFQTAGQVLPLADARDAVGQPEEARQLLGDLCERGLLATDGQNLRFWHQTIQEYFYAGSVVRSWRGSKQQVGRMPRSLRRLAAKTEEKEALSFVVAHLSDQEAEAALRYGLPLNPALAISWADDLSLEGRAIEARELFPSWIRRLSGAACRYTKLGNEQTSIFIFLGCLTPFLAMVFVTITSFFYVEILERPTSDKLVLFFVLLGIVVAYLPFLDALRCPSVEKLESALGAIPEIRDPIFRKDLGALAREISHSRFARRDIRALAQGVSLMEAIHAKELITLLRTSDEPYAAIRLTGHLETPLVMPLLEEIVRLNSFLSLAALEAVAVRSTRLRHERPQIKGLLWTVWENDALDWRLRRLAYKLLVEAGEHPKGGELLFRRSVFRSLAFLLIGLVLIVTSFAALLSTLNGPVFAIIFLIFLSCLAVLTWWDARRIGARRIQGHPMFENGAPWQLALSVFFLSFLIVPLYLSNRQFIRRDAAPVDWDAILQAIQAQEPQGDSLSITHSPPSPRR